MCRKVLCANYRDCVEVALRTVRSLDCRGCQAYEIETLEGEDLEIQTVRAALFILTLWPELRWMR